MDQDSVLPNNYIEQASEFFNEEDVAIICPRYWDVNVYSKEEFERKTPKEPISYIKRCISSGSLCRIEVIRLLGGFDETMFIDYVDHDYCYSVIGHGYRIVQLNSCVMEHRIGKSEVVSLFGRRQVIYNHPPIRKYYYFRNRVYYARPCLENDNG